MMIMVVVMMMVVVTLRKMSSDNNWIARVGFPIRMSPASLQGGDTQGNHQKNHHRHRRHHLHLLRPLRDQGVCDAKVENAGVGFSLKRGGRSLKIGEIGWRGEARRRGDQET